MNKQMLDLAEELENIRKRGHFPNDSLIEDVVAALRSSAVSEHAQRVSRDAIERAIHPFCFSGKNSDAIADAVLSLFNEPQTAPDEAVADQIVGQIEERFPDWRSYRDLIDCIDCTLHRLRADAYSQAVSDEGKS